MLTNPQKAMIKRGQREAGLDDAEYREALNLLTGRSSSTDPALGDRDFDKIMAYIEAIYEHEVSAGRLQPGCKRDSVFQQKGYWRKKNTRQETSRDRYTLNSLNLKIDGLEHSLREIGCGPDYLAAVRQKTTKGVEDLHGLHAYAAALERTLKAKQRHQDANPF